MTSNGEGRHSGLIVVCGRTNDSFHKGVRASGVGMWVIVWSTR
jgi:hypothetical protein